MGILCQVEGGLALAYVCRAQVKIDAKFFSRNCCHLLGNSHLSF